METKNNDIEGIIRKHHNFFNTFKPHFIESVRKYTEDSYSSINNSIRENKPFSTEDQLIVNDLDELFNKVEPITETLTLYRGVNTIKQVKADGAFISSSYSWNQAEQFAQRECCLVVFNIPPGTKVLFIESISSRPLEREVLIDRLGDFSITLVQEGIKEKSLSHILDINERRYKGLTKIFVSYIPKRSVWVEPAKLQDVIEIAMEQLDYIKLVLDIMPEEEYELFKDDRELLKEQIIGIMRDRNINEIDYSLVDSIIEKLEKKYG